MGRFLCASRGKKKYIHSYNYERSFLCMTPETFFPRMRFLWGEQFNLGHFLFGLWYLWDTSQSLFFPSYYPFHCLWLCPKHQKFSLVPFWGIYLSWNNAVNNFYNFERILAILTVPLTGCVMEMRSSFSWIIATTFLKRNQSLMFFEYAMPAETLLCFICESVIVAVVMSGSLSSY